MDFMSVIGAILGIVLMLIGIVLNKSLDGIYSINFTSMISFYDLTSIAIVIGGTFAALMMSYPAKFLKNIPKHLKIIFFPTKYNPVKYIDELVEFAKEARINGLLALESKLNDVDDEFLKSSLMMVVDAVDSEKVKEILESKLDYLDERHAEARSFYERGGAYSPAFGMIGTLIGLVKLLGRMSEDPDSIGPNMAVALLTTFYGTVLSNLVFSPIASKLKVRHGEEYLCKMIICEGVQAIQAGDNPKFIREKLMQLLPNNVAIENLSEDGTSENKSSKKKGKK